MASELYAIQISDDLYPVSVRSVRDDDGMITITYEYLLKGVDSRDPESSIQPLTNLFTRVLSVNDEIDPFPAAVISAIQTLGGFMETLAVAKESENPYT